MSNTAKLTIRVTEELKSACDAAGADKVREVIEQGLSTSTPLVDNSMALQVKVDELEALVDNLQEEIRALKSKKKPQPPESQHVDNDTLRMLIQKGLDDIPSDRPTEVLGIQNVDTSVPSTEKARIAAMLARTKPGSGKKAYQGRPGVPFTALVEKAQRKDQSPGKP